MLRDGSVRDDALLGDRAKHGPLMEKRVIEKVRLFVSESISQKMRCSDSQ